MSLHGLAILFFQVQAPPARVGADGIQKYKLQNICIQSASTGAGLEKKVSLDRVGTFSFDRTISCSILV